MATKQRVPPISGDLPWPRIVIGPSLPIRGDVVFVSSDNNGTPGRLNSMVLNQLGIPIESLKAKLYLGIANSSSGQRARQVAAFVFAEKFDPDWLDALYFRKARKRTQIGAVGLLDHTLASMIGSQEVEMLALFHLLGRRPIQKTQPKVRSNPPSAEGES